MALRIRIPFLVDVVLVKDDAEMAWLNNEPALDRQLSGRGGWINRMVWRKAQSLRVDNSSLLPVFEPRGNAARAADQEQAEAMLSGLAGHPQPFDLHLVATLGRYVGGSDPNRSVGVAVQEIIGRLFDPLYRATKESYDDARVVAAVLSACPVTMLRVLWWRVTRRLAKSKDRIWKLARGNPAVVHGTAIAMHNIVDSLARMRESMRTDGPWHSTPAEAAAEALVAPPRLLREGMSEPAKACPFGAGTLVIFRLKRMHEGSDDNSLAFSDKEWSQCPAHAIVPRLLEDVWKAATQDHSYRRYPRARASWLYRLAIRPLARSDQRVPWYRRTWTAFFTLWALRTVLRRENLYDTSFLPSKGRADLSEGGPNIHRWRTADGSFNDLQDPDMGRAGMRFGRNVPLAYTSPRTVSELLDPNPRLVSQMLLTRKEFIPARSLNMLAAAWIQFQVHDWFSHDTTPDRTRAPFEVPVLDRDDKWPGDRPMRIDRTAPDPTSIDPASDGPLTFVNRVTHWWDASQLYGSDVKTQSAVRSGLDGKLKLLPGSTLLPLDPDPNKPGIELAGFNDNWWLGLSLFHHLFTWEHNAICDRLRAEYPSWQDEELFQTARLITAALIAKIHEVEWVPTVLAHPSVQRGARASWWGVLGSRIAKNLGRLPSRIPLRDMLSGIPGSLTDHHTAPYAISEEFVSVYRMHSFMMPDDLIVYRATDGTVRARLPLNDILGPGSRRALENFGPVDLVYSFARTVPGGLSLGNYPLALQQFDRSFGKAPPSWIDIATVDILRDRERGVPRYNQFRELLRLPPIRSFEELNKQWADELRKVYETMDQVDLMIGMLAETPPPGFGFGDTTFRIFLLMNGRRLKSDRFFTTDYTPAVYTRTGLDWVDTNDLQSVLVRHLPELKRVVERVESMFAPWPNVV